MAAIEASLSLFSSSTPLISPLRLTPLNIHFPISTPPTLSLKFPLISTYRSKKLSFKVCCTAVQELPVEEKSEQTPEQEYQRRKLFVQNLPWSNTVADVKTLFGECGTVTDIEIIKQKSGKSRGFAFVTMASGEEAQAVIEKFDSYELSGRIIKVEFAKRFKKPSRPPPAGPPPGDTRHKLYVSNLAWKVRSNDLKEFFAASANPIGARVVFEPSGRSAGYGFVSFATREEAEAVISDLNGKELLGRPVSLKFSLKSTDESESEEENTSEGQPAES